MRGRDFQKVFGFGKYHWRHVVTFVASGCGLNIHFFVRFWEKSRNTKSKFKGQEAHRDWKSLITCTFQNCWKLLSRWTWKHEHLIRCPLRATNLISVIGDRVHLRIGSPHLVIIRGYEKFVSPCFCHFAVWASTALLRFPAKRMIPFWREKKVDIFVPL